MTCQSFVLGLQGRYPELAEIRRNYNQARTPSDTGPPRTKAAARPSVRKFISHPTVFKLPVPTDGQPLPPVLGQRYALFTECLRESGSRGRGPLRKNLQLNL